MLSFFRRIINSKAGVVVTFIVLGVIAIAFAAGDVTNISSMAGGITGSEVAKVGSAKITANDLRTAAQNEVAAYRQEQPTLDMAQFIAAGGFEGTLQREITGLSLEQFGKDQGMVVSRRLIDGQIASIPAFRGPNGQFDPALYQQLLAQRKMTDLQVRTDLERTTFAQQLTVPTIGATQFATQMALPYASLLLESGRARSATSRPAWCPQAQRPATPTSRPSTPATRAATRCPSVASSAMRWSTLPPSPPSPAQATPRSRATIRPMPRSMPPRRSVT
ncbi:SurA N-terminal domain-containing protein [Sphingomonas sp. I4]